MLFVGIPALLFGLLMMTRGWIYTIWPEGKVAEKRKRRNLRVGFTTDMRLFGRKVRRLGLMIVLVGAALTGWDLSERREEALRAETAPSPASPSPRSPDAAATSGR